MTTSPGTATGARPAEPAPGPRQPLRAAPADRPAPIAAGTPEAGLEEWFFAAVRRAGGKAIKLVPVEAGMPDRLVLVPLLGAEFVELKPSKAERLSAIQRVMHERLRVRYGAKVTTLHGRAAAARWIADRFGSAGQPARVAAMR